MNQYSALLVAAYYLKHIINMEFLVEPNPKKVLKEEYVVGERHGEAVAACYKHFSELFTGYFMDDHDPTLIINGIPDEDLVFKAQMGGMGVYVNPPFDEKGESNPICVDIYFVLKDGRVGVADVDHTPYLLEDLVGSCLWDVTKVVGVTQILNSERIKQMMKEKEERGEL